mgnify:CR=1 FL=1
MVLTGETREMRENATPAKAPAYKTGTAEMRSLFLCCRVILRGALSRSVFRECQAPGRNGLTWGSGPTGWSIDRRRCGARSPDRAILPEPWQFRRGGRGQSPFPTFLLPVGHLVGGRLCPAPSFGNMAVPEERICRGGPPGPPVLSKYRYFRRTGDS